MVGEEEFSATIIWGKQLPERLTARRNKRASAMAGFGSVHIQKLTSSHP